MQISKSMNMGGWRVDYSLIFNNRFEWLKVHQINEFIFKMYKIVGAPVVKILPPLPHFEPRWHWSHNSAYRIGYSRVVFIIVWSFLVLCLGFIHFRGTPKSHNSFQTQRTMRYDHDGHRRSEGAVPPKPQLWWGIFALWL